MRSDPATRVARGRWTWLRSQGLGVCCGLSTAWLLAVGSVVLAATRDTVSASLQMDDVRFFFTDPSPAHLWFYLLLPVMTLYALNVALATWHSVATRWRAGMRNPQAYAAAVVHVAFLLALVAHLVGGLGGKERAAVVGSAWTELTAGEEGRLLSLDVDRLPTGMPRAIRASIETRSPGGATATTVLGYNQPISRRLGADLVLLQQPVAISSATLVSGGDRCTVIPGGTCTLGGREFLLADLRVKEGHGAMAEVVVGEREGWIFPGQPVAVDTGPPLMLAQVGREAAVAVRLRHAPGNPWALVSAILLVVGVLLMWRRFQGGA
jgi:hypothetical protein